MASVRMTQQMRHDISRAAETAYDTANPEPKPSTEFVDGLKQAIINSPEQKFFCEMIKLGYDRGLDKRHGKSLLPQKNKEPVTSIDLRRAKTSNISTTKTMKSTLFISILRSTRSTLLSKLVTLGATQASTFKTSIQLTNLNCSHNTMHC